MTGDQSIDRLRPHLRHLLCGSVSPAVRAVTLDYDGTLCDAIDRLGVMRKPMADGLGRLLEEGVHIGDLQLARGDSVWSAIAEGPSSKVSFQGAGWVSQWSGAQMASRRAGFNTMEAMPD